MSTAEVVGAVVERRSVRLGVVASSESWRTQLVAHVTEHDDRMEIESIRDPGRPASGMFDIIVVDDSAAFVPDVIASTPSHVRLVGVHDAAGELAR